MKDINVKIKKMLSFLSDKMYLKLYFFFKYKKRLNLKEPKTFNEKLNWLKLNDRKEIYVTMVDKYKAKEYVASLIGSEYIIPTIGVYDKFDEIDFDKLPQQFVIKCNHDSGSVIVCRDKNKFDIKEAKKKIEEALKRNFYLDAREWAYKNVERKILIEEYMQDGENKCLKDYKFYCFNGKPLYLYVSEGLENHKTARISFLDLDFNKAPFKRGDYKELDVLPQKPKNYEKMIRFAEKFSKDIPFLRVDFYEINEKLYFGELTFAPCGGFMKFEPEEWDLKLGDLIKLDIDK